jgi:hypothetical protein
MSQRFKKILRLSRRWDLNPRPTVYETVALPAELLRLLLNKNKVNGKKYKLKPSYAVEEM